MALGREDTALIAANTALSYFGLQGLDFCNLVFMCYKTDP